MVDPLKAELGPASWDDDVADWMARARRGVGVTGRTDSTTAYFWGRFGWGGPIRGACAPPPDPEPEEEEGPPDDKPGNPDPGKPEKPPKPEPPGRDDPTPDPPDEDD
jgi:hypothetical protein